MKKYIILLFLSLVFAACVNPNDDDKDNFEGSGADIIISASENLTPSFGADGGSSSISFISKADWVAVVNDQSRSWCSVSPEYGSKGNKSITINAAPNDTPDSRNATIQLVSGTVTRTIDVSQKQRDALTVTSDKFEVAKEGGSVVVEVEANVQLNYKIDEGSQNWIKYVSAKALKSSFITFDIEANETGGKREGSILFTDGVLEAKVTIYQDGGPLPSIVITQSDYTVGPDGETIMVEVASNVDVEVVMPEVDWINENSTKSLSTHTYCYEISPNGNFDSRSAQILFRNVENGLQEQVTISQAQKDAIVLAENEYYIKCDVTQLSFDVSTNVEFDVQINCDWIQQIEVKGLSVRSLNFSVMENLSDEKRSATITLESGNLSQKITVVQGGKTKLTVSTDKVKVGADKCVFTLEIFSNAGYSVTSLSDWIKEQSSSGADGTYKHTFIVDKNSSTDSREGAVAVYNDETSFYVAVEQEGANAYLRVGKNQYNVGPDGESIRVTVESNVDVEVVMPQAGWISREWNKSLTSDLYYFEIAPNEDANSRSAEIIFRNSGKKLQSSVTVIQAAELAFTVSTTFVEVGAERSVFDITVSCITGYQIVSQSSWMREVSSTGGNGVYNHVFEAQANSTEVSREGTILVQTNKGETVTVKVRQGAVYVSGDYSKDGVVVTLQRASEGAGINVVLLGDGYSDRQIAKGLYRNDMEFVYDNIFTKEPYKSFKHLFNVSYVNVVSATEGFEYGKTALECGFGEGTRVYGNDKKCFEYAKRVVSESELIETLVVVVLNSDKYAGTCWMYYPGNSVTTDYGSGVSLAYFPKGSDKTVFSSLLHHEACGHGFSKLDDEYWYTSNGTIPQKEVDSKKSHQNSWGWWKNVDFTDNLALIRWAHFLENDKYKNEGLGAYEGASTYWKGVWRPTDNSIMRDNTGEFNAPSREAIYYRIHKLAYGKNWEYSYEDFVEYDKINRKGAGAAPQSTQVLPLQPMEPLHPPVVVGPYR